MVEGCIRAISAVQCDKKDKDLVFINLIHRVLTKGQTINSYQYIQRQDIQLQTLKLQYISGCTSHS